MCRETHTEEHADAQVRRSRNTEGSRQEWAGGEAESGRHTGTRTEITPAGISPAVPSREPVLCACACGEGVPGGWSPQPLSCWWGLRRMELGAVRMQREFRGGDSDSSSVQPCCRGQAREDFACRLFAQD